SKLIRSGTEFKPLVYATYSFDGSIPITRAMDLRLAIKNDSAPVPEPMSSSCPSSGTLVRSRNSAPIRRLHRPMNCSYDSALARIVVPALIRSGPQSVNKTTSALFDCGHGIEDHILAESAAHELNPGRQIGNEVDWHKPGRQPKIVDAVTI